MKEPDQAFLNGLIKTLRVIESKYSNDKKIRNSIEFCTTGTKAKFFSQGMDSLCRAFWDIDLKTVDGEYFDLEEILGRAQRLYPCDAVFTTGMLTQEEHFDFICLFLEEFFGNGRKVKHGLL